MKLKLINIKREIGEYVIIVLVLQRFVAQQVPITDPPPNT